MVLSYVALASLLHVGTGQLLHGSLTSHMVLQRDTKSKLWGQTSSLSPGDTVSVQLSDDYANVYETYSGFNGTWEMELNSRDASNVGLDIKVWTDNETTTITDVLFGDVYVCSGQSNMKFGLTQDINASTECPNTENYPDIRLLWYSANDDPTRADWTRPYTNYTCTDSYVWHSFSAVCWYFGKDVYESQDGKIPIGLVASTIGSTSVQAWSSPDALTKCDQSGKKPDHEMWNLYIDPILPMVVQGWLWYQGESNVGGPEDYYSCQFPAMINDWRQKWNQGLATINTRPKPFLYVILAPYIGQADQGISNIRLEQLETLEKVELTALAAAYDYGDMFSPPGAIHPRYKGPVGQRLAYAARAIIYGEDIPYLHPTLQSATVKDSTLTLKFDSPVEIRHGHQGNWSDTLPNATYEAKLEINGKIASKLTTNSNGDVEVEIPSHMIENEISSGYDIAYLLGDWPVPSIYAKDSGMPGLPAKPFSAKATQTSFENILQVE